MILFYNNGGETMDRYIVLIETAHGFDHYGFSENANSPQGFNQYSHTSEINNQNEKEKILFEDLPLMVQREVIKRLS